MSLAAALAVPQATAAGEPFPARDLVVLAAAVAIVVTLVVQAPLLPVVVRWARLPPDTALDEERLFAQQHATRAALEALPDLAAQLEVDDDVAERVRRELRKRLLLEQETGQEKTVPVGGQGADALRLALLARKRAAVVGLRDSGRIDDTVLRQVQHRLDLEEVRLVHREEVE